MPKREASRAHTRRLTRPWSFQKNLSILPRKNVSWQSGLSRRETGRTLEINGFGSCYERPPKSPSWGQQAKSREAAGALSSHPKALTWPQSCLGMREITISREHRGATWAPKPATGSGVRLLPALKSVKRQGWWKWMFALSQRLAVRGREADSCQKADSFPLTFGEQELFFIDRGRGLRAETAQSALTVILKLATIVVWPASFWLSTLNLQSQDQFFPISLKSAFRIVAACVVKTVWSSRRYLVPPGGLVYKTAHRIWLWILPIALEEELKVLDCV